MPRATVNRWNDLDIELEYETFGDPADPPVLLVMGYTAQLIQWPEGFCRMLADHGRYVIRYDNRDCGLSTRLDGVTVDLDAIMRAGRNPDPATLPPAPYTLSAFSDDAFGLLTALGIDAAHIVGVSMGGMIVQTMAIEHPERVLTMTSMSSTTGEAGYGEATREAAAALLAPPAATRDAVIDQTVERARIFGSSIHFDANAARAMATAAYDRAFYPEGSTRQFTAIRSSGQRGDALRNVPVATLVIHGTEDPIIQMSGGERTAELVPGARLLRVEHMSHDLPAPLWPLLTGAIAEHTAS